MDTAIITTKGKATMYKIKHVSVIRNDDEKSADENAAKRMHLSVHAWRRLVLNIANGLAEQPDMLWVAVRATDKS